MDKKVGVLALLLSAMFGGCSSDESVINEGGENNGQKIGYIAVNIVQAESASSRAVDVPEGTLSGGFMAGDEDENFAEDATFIIFNEEGTHKSTQTIHLTPENGSATDPERERIYRAVLVIDNDAEDGSETVTQVPDERYAGEIFCVLNAPSDIRNFNVSDSRTKDELKKLINDCSACTKGAFIMSNSTYREPYRDEHGVTRYTVISGTKFTTDNFCSSSSAALENPVDVYVERVVARVDTKKVTPGFTNTGVDPSDTDNSIGHLDIRITGIEIANIADKSYIFKNVDNYGTNSGWPNWSIVWDTENKRCYWEFVPTNVNYINQSYNTIAGATTEEAATPNPNADKLYLSLDEDDKYKTRTYIQPNTSAQKTSVLVTAQLLDDKLGDNGEVVGKKPADLVWIKGGYFTSKGALNLVCQYLKSNEWAVKIESEGTTTFRDIEPEELVWARYVDPDAESKVLLNSTGDFKDYQAIAQVDASKLPSGASICKAEKVNTNDAKEKFKENGGGSYSINDLNGAAGGRNYCLAAQTDLFAEVFKDGLCYYFVEIDQTNILGTIPSGTTHYKGVVRNHIYDLSLKGIKGVGTAVFDPEAIIIPQKPNHDKFYYLAAQINVLKWKVVKQGITFGD